MEIKRGNKKIHVFCVFVIWLIMITCYGSVQAQESAYPIRPVNVNIGMSAGGSTDIACRALIDASNKYLKNPLVPINKPGGGGTISTMDVIRSKPDGYTLGVGSAAQTIVAPLSGMAPYKDISGLTFISQFAAYVYPLLVRSDAPWKTWDELIAWARKNPRGLKVGTTAARSLDSKGYALWHVEKRENVQFTYVPFKGSSDVLTALLGGHVHLFLSTLDASTNSYVTEGKLRNLLYIGSNKITGYENIPTMKDVYGYEHPSFMVVFGPKGLPGAIVQTLEGVFAKATKDANFIKILDRMDTPVVFNGSDYMTRYIQDTYARVGKDYDQLKAEDAQQMKK
jgi:tripartite-type tricarboxylate transporter receptor subunit TctC